MTGTSRPPIRTGPSSPTPRITIRESAAIPIPAEAAFDTPFRAISDAITAGAIHTAAAIVRALPERAAIAAVEAAICVFQHTRRTIAEHNLRHAQIPDPARVMAGLRRHVARSTVHFAASVLPPFEVQGAEHYRAARQRDRGVILSSLHCGNFELAAAFHGPVVAPVQTFNVPVDRYLAQRRRRFGAVTLPNCRSVRPLLAALQRGEDVAFLDDLLLDGIATLEASFFHRSTRVSTAVARFAAMSGAPVVPAICVWQHNRYLLRYYPPLPFTADIARDTQTIASWYESVIRQYADQYFWFVPRWPDACSS